MRTFHLILLATLLMLSIGLSSNAALEIEENAKVFYVSTNGSNLWSGTQPNPNDQSTDGPFATIQRARDAVRDFKAQNGLSQPIYVLIRKGTYFLEQPLVFQSIDSGTTSAPVTYAAYEGEEAIISGGREFKANWAQEGNTLYTTIPSVKRNERYFHQLFVNGERYPRARTPNDGYYLMGSPMRLKGPAHFTYQNNDIQPQWANLGDVDIIGLSKWAEIRMPIQKVDAVSKTVTLTKQVPRYNWQGVDHPRYWVENAPGSVDQPGEWRLEGKTGMLRLYPKTPSDQDNIIAPFHEYLIKIEGDPSSSQWVEHLRFHGLTFSHTKAPKLKEGYADMQAAYDISAAFTANGAQNCTIERCEFTHLGNYAVAFEQGCKNNLISYNEMSDLGAGGVKIGETSMRTEEPLITRENVVSDNIIKSIGRIYPAAVGVWVGQSDHNTIAHNLINDTYYTGISVGWTWGYKPTGAHHNIIEYNHVHDIGQGVLSDLGGIYTLGTQPGTVIRNNIFHDIQSHSYGGWGIYPDEGSTQILVENNITYHTKSAGFHQHYGKENIIRNNIFALAKEYQIMRTRAEDHLSFTFERNIVYWNSGELLGSNWSGENYKFDHNLYWDTRGTDFKFDQWTIEEWQAKGQDVNSIIADPLFVDPENLNFNLREDSPAKKIDFQPIDIKKVGPRP